MDPAVLSWDNASNNQWLNSGVGSWIHNPISHYVVAKEKKMPVAEQTGFHPSPSGPAGRHTVGVPRSLGIWKFSKNVDLAREFLRWFYEPAQYQEWVMSGDNYNHPVWRDMENHPVWDIDPKDKPLRSVIQYSHLYGWPAPPDERIQLVTNSYIIPNMVAKVVTTPPSPRKRSPGRRRRSSGRSRRSSAPRLRALHDHQVGLGGLEPHGQQRRVLRRVVPATGGVHAGELQQHDALGLPAALPCLELSTPHGEAAAVFLHGGRHQLAVLRQTGLVVNIDVDDDVG
jgi:hypothetical protein